MTGTEQKSRKKLEETPYSDRGVWNCQQLLSGSQSQRAVKIVFVRVLDIFVDLFGTRR